MHIVVCVKAVPSTTEVKMDPETHTIVRDGRASVINPFDATALEVALAIKDARSAAGERTRVSVMSMGIPDTERLLRDCIARGADDALLLSDRAFAGADTLATTYALSCGISQLDEAVDLIVCGKMAVDGDTAQIGPELAGAFEMPCITDVQAQPVVRGRTLRAKRACDGGRETVEVDLPAVITVAKDAAQLRMPSIPGVLAAETAPVAVKTAADVGADTARTGLAGSPTQVVRSFVPERLQEAVAIEGTPAEQAAALAALIEEGCR